MFEDQRSNLIGNLERAHAAYYEASIFGGPSLHFHLRSLDEAKAREPAAFAECSYAMLASWGMHRMGPGGSKMRDFDEFASSLEDVWPAILSLQRVAPPEMNEDDWQRLKQVFCGIRAMASGTTLVGNSKVMAHALPNLVPPIDRQYTLRYLHGHGQIRNGLEREWRTLRQVLEGFFYPVVADGRFRTCAAEWLEDRRMFPWDTSHLKIVDNLIIGLAKIT